MNRRAFLTTICSLLLLNACAIAPAGVKRVRRTEAERSLHALLSASLGKAAISAWQIYSTLHSGAPLVADEGKKREPKEFKSFDVSFDPLILGEVNHASAELWRAGFDLLMHQDTLNGAKGSGMAVSGPRQSNGLYYRPPTTAGFTLKARQDYPSFFRSVSLAVLAVAADAGGGPPQPGGVVAAAVVIGPHPRLRGGGWAVETTLPGSAVLSGTVRATADDAGVLSASGDLYLSTPVAAPAGRLPVYPLAAWRYFSACSGSGLATVPVRSRSNGSSSIRRTACGSPIGSGTRTSLPWRAGRRV